MFISEYGADAWDARGAGMENVAAQAEATTALTQLILARSTARHTDGVTLGGTIEPIHNAVSLAEIAVEKGAKSILLPVSCRRQLFDLSDDMATRLDVEFYQDAKDALLKALAE